MRNIYILLIIVLVAIGLFFIVPMSWKQDMLSQTPPTTKVFDGRNSTIVVEGVSVTLKNGVAEVAAAPNSSQKITTRYFGNEAKGDVNGDGREDVAFLISQSGGGTGLFYYAVVALGTSDGYKTTNAFLVGDRIAPQTTQIQSDARELRVNYAERAAGEPMTAQPSVGATLYLKVTNAGVLEGLMK